MAVTAFLHCLHHLCFGAPGEAFARVRQSLSRAAVTEVEPPRGAPEGGLWVRDPDGNLVNIRDEAPDPEPGDPPLLLNAPGHAPRQAIRGCPDRGHGAAPRRLGHVLLFSPDLERQIDFYTRVLGLKLSDRSRDFPPEDSLYLWGPPVPSDFGENKELEAR